MQPPGTLRELALARIGRAYADKWSVESLIDMGGMAAVYAGTHRNGKRVALKILHAHIACDADLRARFLREGYVANLIEHPGAVQVLDDHHDPVHNEVLLVMELLDGQSIERWLRSSGGSMPMTDALAVGFQVLDVLEAFHQVGVVHRDIKPANLFVTQAGVVKVLDFGLARMKDRSGGSTTGVGTVLGTASYIPPEQAQGLPDRIDSRSDVFAVGAVLFHMLSGSVVHEGRSSIDRLFSAMRTPSRPLLSVAPRVPPEISEVIDKALSFERDGRYSSAREMRDALRGAYLTVFRAPVARPMAHTPLEGFDEAFAEPSAVVEVSFGPPPTTRPEQSG